MSGDYVDKISLFLGSDSEVSPQDLTGTIQTWFSVPNRNASPTTSLFVLRCVFLPATAWCMSEPKPQPPERSRLVLGFKSIRHGRKNKFHVRS